MSSECNNIAKYDTEIDISGVIQSKQEAAITEIKWYLSILEMCEYSFRIRRVIVASDFNVTINQLSEICRVNNYQYDAKRLSGKAIGKVLENIDDGQLSYSIILDGAFINKWEESERALRLELFLHEITHIVIYASRSKGIEPSKFHNRSLTDNTVEGTCKSMAVVSGDEYHVDRIVDSLFEKLITDDTGKPVKLANITNYKDSFNVILSKMPVIVSGNIYDFKTWKIEIGQLWSRMLEFIVELLTIFAHYAGVHDREGDWIPIPLWIMETESYQLFLSSHLETIHEQWVKSFRMERNFDVAESMLIVQAEILKIFGRCGLTLSNIPNGIYVKVDFH